MRHLITLLIFMFYLGVSFADEDPIMKKRLISNLEIVLGDASKDTLSIYDLRGRRLIAGISVKIAPKYNRKDEVGAGNVLGNYRDEIVVGFGKERKEKKSFRGKIVIYSPRDFHIIRSFNIGFSGYDDLTVGNVIPDKNGYDEIIIGSAYRDTLEVYNSAGRKLASANVEYQRYDRIASGDVDGDGINEILLGDASRDSIRIFKFSNGALVEVSSFLTEKPFSREDDVGAGDVDGDGIDEIIFFENPNTIRIYDFQGGEKYLSKTVKYGKYSHVSVGDLNSDGKAEIVIANAKDDLIHVYDMNGTELGRINAGIERYDRIALVDYYGDSLVVGKPRGPIPVTIKNQVIAVLSEPPKEKSLFGNPEKSGGIFYSSYKNQQQQTTQQTVTAISSFTFSAGLQAQVGSLSIGGAKMSLKYQLSRYSERTRGTTLQTTIGQNMIADNYEDRLFAITSTYHLYEYPIISPRNLAVKNGKQQYVLVSVPVSLQTNTIGIYKSNTHINGYVATYPETKRKLYHYSRDNQIAEWVVDITCTGTEGYFAQKNGTVNISKTKTTHEISIGFTAGGGLPGIAKVKESFKGNYSNTKISTYKVAFEETTNISFKYEGQFPGCGDPNKHYKIGAVLYYDSVDGHLILDYYVPQKGSYYKKPSVKIPAKPLLLDKNGRLLLQKIQIRKIKIRPELLKRHF